MPTATIWRDDSVMWHHTLSVSVKADLGMHVYARLVGEVMTEHNAEVKVLDKNGLFISYVLERAWTQGVRSATLEGLCRAIIRFAEYSSQLGSVE